MNNNNQTKPWLDTNGTIHSDGVLREISKKWDAETWEQFLVDTVEGSNSYQREELISPHAYNEALDKMSESIWESTSSPQTLDDCELVRRICKDHLTPKQQFVIRMTFWDCHSERRIAEIMDISRSTVAVQKKDALNKIKHLFEARQTNFPRSERAVKKMPNQKGSTHEDIQEIYLQAISEAHCTSF